MDLNAYRKRIDEIDDELVRLFAERMEVAAGIAAYKKKNDLPVLDVRREREKLRQIAEKTPEELRDDTARLYTLIFELSRAYQTRLLGTQDEEGKE